jgi:hypothetical protein
LSVSSARSDQSTLADPTVAAAIPAMMPTSDFSWLEAGGLMPADPCTMLIESSTVTIWFLPTLLRSISVRPRQGRMNAVSPGSKWVWLSLVATWTVSFCFDNAFAVTGVSGVALAKLPPRPMKACDDPSSMAPIAARTLCPCARGALKSTAPSSASRKAPLVFVDADCAVTLDVGMSAYRAEAGALAADIAAQEHEIGDLADRDRLNAGAGSRPSPRCRSPARRRDRSRRPLPRSMRSAQPRLFLDLLPSWSDRNLR